jgi:hypothetical protein
MYAVTDYDDLLKVALEEGIDVVITGAGLLLKLPANIDSSVLESRATKIYSKGIIREGGQNYFSFLVRKIQPGSGCCCCGRSYGRRSPGLYPAGT